MRSGSSARRGASDRLSAHALASTNAIHLYDDLENTFDPGRVSSSRERGPGSTPETSATRAPEGEWIIDDTVYRVHEAAVEIVRSDDRSRPTGTCSTTTERLQSYLDYRDRVFLAPRPLAYYTDAIRHRGLRDRGGDRADDLGGVDEWYEFLSAYADAVLGWVGGSVKVDERAASEEAAADRLRLLGESLAAVFGGRSTFDCCWTYITALRT